jgi:hypothetical protein
VGPSLRDLTCGDWIFPWLEFKGLHVSVNLRGSPGPSGTLAISEYFHQTPPLITP